MREAVSIVIPYFNASEYIEATLESALRAMCDLDEIVITNDGSTQADSQQLKGILAKFSSSQIRLIEHKKNMGGAAARNTGVRNSIHRWIFNLDSDNLIPEKLISQLISYATLHQLDVCGPGEVRFFNSSPEAPTHSWRFEDVEFDVLDHLRSQFVPSASGNYLFTRDIFDQAGGFPEFAGGLDAWGFGFRVVASGGKMRILPNSYYLHRYGHDSYYVRESRKMKELNYRASSIVLEYSSQISERILLKMLGRRFRDSWFSNIENNPLRINRPRSGAVVKP